MSSPTRYSRETSRNSITGARVPRGRSGSAGRPAAPRSPVAAAAAAGAAEPPPPPPNLPPAEAGSAGLRLPAARRAAGSACRSSATITSSPALSPLTTCVALSPTIPVWTRCVATPAVALDGHATSRAAPGWDREPLTQRDDAVGRGAHPALEPVGALVERDRDRVADRAPSRSSRVDAAGEHAD